MLNIFGDTTLGETYDKVYQKYNPALALGHQDFWKREDIDGWNPSYAYLTLWYTAIWMAVMLKEESTSGLYSLEELKTRYTLSELIECYHCLKIPFQEMLDCVGFTCYPVEIEGIEGIGIEVNFWIENKLGLDFGVGTQVTDSLAGSLSTPEQLEYLNELLSTPDGCTINLTNECETNGSC